MSLLGGVAQLSGSTNPQKLDDSSEEDEGTVEEISQGALKDVFWDRLVVFLSTAIIGLTALDILTELLRGGSEVVCFLSDDLNLTEGQEAYINNYCVRSIPDTQYFPIFILVHGVLIATWHYVWRASSATHFDYFLSLANQLIRLNDDPQGFYPPKNRIIVSKLVSEFCTYKRSRILRWYQLKVIAQILTVVASLLLSFLVFTDFNVDFKCPRDLKSDESVRYWPLPGTQIQCIFTSLRLFSLLQVIDVLLLVFILASLIGALFWSIWRHPMELGPENVAQFSFTSTLASSYYIPRPMLHNFKNFVRRLCSKRVFRELAQRFLVPRLRTDLDFLLMMLYRTDSGLGHAFKEGQVYEEYSRLSDADFQSLSAVSSGVVSFIDPKLVKRDLDKMLQWNLSGDVKHTFSPVDSSLTLDIPDVIRGAVLGYAQRAPNNTRALDISFGSYGFSTTLAKVFQHVGFVNFDPTYKVEGEPVVELKFPTNITGFRCHDNILSQEADSSNMLTDLLETLWSEPGVYNKFKTEFIVIGPMDQFSQINTARLLLDTLSGKFLNDSGRRALLLIIVPVSIEGKDARKQFYTFIPPKHLFQSINHSVQVVSNCDNPLQWLATATQPSSHHDHPESEDKQQEGEDSKGATAPKSKPIELQPVGQVALTVSHDPGAPEKGKKEAEEKEGLISTSEENGEKSQLPSKQPPSRSSDETKVYPKLHLLQCGGSVCEFEFTLYEFVYEPPVTEAPPPPPSDTSSESEIGIEEEKQVSKKLNVDTDAPPVSKLPKVENTEVH